MHVLFTFQGRLNLNLQFTAPDLSDIARSLDALEESYDDSNTGNASTNMDDTGWPLLYPIHDRS
jgi:hypothetical protein